MPEEPEVRTYQTRWRGGSGQDRALFAAYGDLFGRVERTLFARLEAGDELNDLKREFLPRFGITARQFNATAVTVRGIRQSVLEGMTRRIKDLECRIARARKVLSKARTPVQAHQKKRRLATLEAR